MQLFGFANLF